MQELWEAASKGKLEEVKVESYIVRGQLGVTGRMNSTYSDSPNASVDVFCDKFVRSRIFLGRVHLWTQGTPTVIHH